MHLYYSPLSDCSSTRIFKRTHTYRNIWTTANQRGGPPFTISDWFRPRYEPNVSVVEQQRYFLSRGDFCFFLEWLDAPVRPKFFFSRTPEKLGRTCDQIGRTLEPCKYQWWSVTKYNYFVTVLKYIFQVSVLYWSSFILSNFYFYFTTFQSIRSYFLLHYIS